MVNYNLMLLMDMNILDAVCCKNHLGYEVVCLRAFLATDRSVNWGVVLVTRESPEVWYVDSTRLHGLNMVSCDIVSGLQCIPSSAHTSPHPHRTTSHT